MRTQTLAVRDVPCGAHTFRPPNVPSLVGTVSDVPCGGPAEEGSEGEHEEGVGCFPHVVLLRVWIPRAVRVMRKAEGSVLTPRYEVAEEDRRMRQLQP